MTSERGPEKMSAEEVKRVVRNELDMLIEERNSLRARLALDREKLERLRTEMADGADAGECEAANGETVTAWLAALDVVLEEK
jgi:hypothetical protein